MAGSEVRILSPPQKKYIMTEIRDSELRRVSLVGGYEVLESPIEFRLKKLGSLKKQYPDASALVFGAASEASETANLLSLAFQEVGVSLGISTLVIGKVLEYEVSGGKNGACRIFRLNDGQRDGKSIEPKSPEELIEALKQFFGEKK